jgi:Na+/melibiose symporter-like transporter
MNIDEKKSSGSLPKEAMFDSLSPVHFWAYGVGHFLNDLTAACWFNYLLFFLQTVVKTSAAPIALLVGQLCDGVTTPVVGYLSDKYDTRIGTVGFI